ncbi:MAG TPA: manganese efflux pump MntP family protein [Vulgatibacter sp.]|nr:manganese efflux pump MntP family protein [Vulgatibacter sp.]
MDFPAILLLACGLAMDAAAVSASRGMAASRIRIRHAVLVATFFGGFQALMPLVGWLAGSRVGPLLGGWDRWIAFVLLAGIGAKMLWEAHSPEEVPDPGHDEKLFGLRVMFLLAVATSIDALAAGFTLPLLGAPLLPSIVTIGVVTAVLSVAGLVAGRRFGALLGRRLDAAGGVVLVGLAIKSLIS